MSTCNRLDLESVGSWPTMPKNVLGTRCYSITNTRCFVMTPRNIIKQCAFVRSCGPQEYNHGHATASAGTVWIHTKLQYPMVIFSGPRWTNVHCWLCYELSESIRYRCREKQILFPKSPNPTMSAWFLRLFLFLILQYIQISCWLFRVLGKRNLLVSVFAVFQEECTHKTLMELQQHVTFCDASIFNTLNQEIPQRLKCVGQKH